MKRLYFLAICATALLLWSCKKNKIENPIVEIPIKTVIFPIKDIDLKERANWILQGGNQQYSFSILADTLRAVPVSDAYLLRYEKTDYAFNYIGFGLVSPSYYKNPETSLKRSLYATSPVITFPNIGDQSDEVKLRNADALIAINYETPTSNIKDGRFIHRNTLIDFETVNVPNDAVVTVLQSEATKPYNYKAGFYKAIVVFVPVISVKIGTEVYQAQVIDPKGMSGNAHYTFKVIFDTAKKTLSITDLASKSWSAIH